MGIDSFIPSRGTHRGKRFDVDNWGQGLVIDQEGVYFLIDGKFIETMPPEPLWLRQELRFKKTTNAIRNLVKGTS